MGLCGERFRRKAQVLGVEDLFDFRIPLPRSRVLELLAGADLGLVLESFRAGAELVVPMKTYDYLGAGLEVLALVVPEGAADRLVRETGCGIAVTQKSATAVAKALRHDHNEDAYFGELCAMAKMVMRRRARAENARLSARGVASRSTPTLLHTAV